MIKSALDLVNLPGKITEFIKVKERIFKPIKELDAEIRFIENDQVDTDKLIYWIVSIGLCESMGERGYTYTLFYENKPTEAMIVNDAKSHIKEQIEEFENMGLLNHYEEEQFKILKKINRSWLIRQRKDKSRQ